MNDFKTAGQTLVKTTALTTQAYTKLTMVNLKAVAAFLQLEKPGQKKDTLVNRIVAQLAQLAAANVPVDIPVLIHENAGADDLGDSGTQIHAT